MDIAERRRPQDGTFAVIMGERRFDVRAASAPTNYGEKMSLRLLDADGGMVKGGLAKIGLKDSILKPLREICQQPHGMLIVCGPTGSGKTTTLYSALGEIDVYSRNIITIEDPIEYRLEGISQTAVNNAADLTFAKILRSVLRQDPDVILVGELRDLETIEAAITAAETGHVVFGTLFAMVLRQPWLKAKGLWRVLLIVPRPRPSSSMCGVCAQRCSPSSATQWQQASV